MHALGRARTAYGQVHWTREWDATPSGGVASACAANAREGKKSPFWPLPAVCARDSYSLGLRLQLTPGHALNHQGVQATRKAVRRTAYLLVAHCVTNVVSMFGTLTILLLWTRSHTAPRADYYNSRTAPRVDRGAGSAW